MDITERIAAIANRWAHDDAYEIAEAIVAELGLIEETCTYVETETKSVSGGEGVLRHGGQITKVLDYNRTDHRWVSPWVRRVT